jgi:hypothetical protein
MALLGEGDMRDSSAGCLLGVSKRSRSPAACSSEVNPLMGDWNMASKPVWCPGDCMPWRLGDGWNRGTGFGLANRPGELRLGRGDAMR